MSRALSTAFPDPDIAEWLCSEIPTADAPSGTNWSALCDKDLDQLFKDQASQVDFTTRQKTFYAITKMIFDKAARERSVLFLDELDQIGKARGSDDKDVGEMRRLVNTLIQLIDYYPENALLLCATNHAEIIDTAIIRRFQLKIKYEMPSKEFLDSFYDSLLAKFPEDLRNIERKYEISFAEAKDYAFTVVKGNLIEKLEATT